MKFKPEDFDGIATKYMGMGGEPLFSISHFVEVANAKLQEWEKGWQEAYESWKNEAFKHKNFLVDLAHSLNLDVSECYSADAIYKKIEEAVETRKEGH